MSNDHEVGYGKPPKHTQFKKGQSGNPKGRPKGSRNFSTDAKEMLNEPVRLTKGGKPKTVSTQRAALAQLRVKGLVRGEDRSLDKIIDLGSTYNDEEIAETAARLSQTDAEILEAYNQRLLQRAGKSQPDDNEATRNDAAQSPDAAQENDNPPENGDEEDDDDAWLN